jgi:ribosomal protein S18 acetylase RimI-like enzyme
MTLVPAVIVLDACQSEVAARIVELQWAAYAVEADLIGFRDIPPLLENADDVAGLDIEMLGAVEPQRLVAIVGYRRSAEVVDIDRLAVHPSAFRRGIATALLDALHARERDATTFTVSTGALNTPAIQLYRAAGYELVGHEEVSDGLIIVRLVRHEPV